MNRAGLLQETTAWMDTVDLALCLFIYEVCNDYQFEYLSGSDFVNFLNLNPTEREVIVRPKENLRICYMVFSIARTIRPRERGKLWSEEFLKRCGISKSYYDKHRSDVCNNAATKENQDFRKSPFSPVSSHYSYALYRSYTTVWRIFFSCTFPIRPPLAHLGANLTLHRKQKKGKV